jgi:hypothetical protein
MSMIALNEERIMGSTYLWAFILVALTAIVVVITAVAALVGRPRNRLTWSVEMTSPLLSEGVDSLDITYQGQRIQEPYVVEVSLRNAGRRSISSSMFDQGRPIRWRFQVPILALMEASHSSDTTLHDDELLVFPQLILPGQSVKFTVLVDGKPDVSLQSPLADVYTGRTDNGNEATRHSIYRRDIVLLIIATTLTILGSILALVVR